MLKLHQHLLPFTCSAPVEARGPDTIPGASSLRSNRATDSSFASSQILQPKQLSHRQSSAAEVSQLPGGLHGYTGTQVGDPA